MEADSMLRQEPPGPEPPVPQPLFTSYIIVLIINTAIFTNAFILSLYILVRVQKVFKYKDEPSMFWSVFIIALSLFTLVTYNSLNIYN